ncbi:MAG: DMT family transporter [Anaerolineae bacterium]
MDRANDSRMRLRADLVLLLVAVIWGSAFVAQRVAAGHVGPFIYNGTRFLVGGLALLPVIGRRLGSLKRREVLGGGLAGLVIFAAATLQQAGLAFTTAGKAGFITGLYVVLVPLFLALGWGAWSRWYVWIASALAVVGLFLLSGGTRFLTLAPGDGLVLAGAVMWASHVIIISRLADRVDALRLAAVQYLACGLLSTTVGVIVESQTVVGLAAAWWAVLYTGLLSIGLGYTLQVVAQRWTPAPDAAVILSGESVFAALWGWLLLGETMTVRQLTGCALMFVAMLLAQLPHALRARAERQRSPEV